MADNPAQQLVRVERPFDGMALEFDLIDPTNRLVVHRFTFQVVYSTDEESLIIDYAAHQRFTIGK